MPTPYIRITADGRDITSKIINRCISLTITDGVGADADSIALVIDDHDGTVMAPTTGVTLEVEAGYTNDYRNFGQFKVDQVTYTGFPQQISISAQSIDARSAQKQQRVDQYPSDEFPTYGDIFTRLSERMGLTLSLSAEIGDKAVSFEMQSEESDLAFSTRIGKKIDASVTVKAGRLIVVKRGTGKSVSGEDLPQIAVTQGRNLISYSVSRKDKPKHSKVEAKWFDRAAGATVTVEAQAGEEGPTFAIRAPFATAEEAQNAADTQAKELVRGEANASFSIDGHPGARAEAHVRAFSIRDGVDGLWRARTVTHTFGADSPYTTALECELPDAKEES